MKLAHRRNKISDMSKAQEVAVLHVWAIVTQMEGSTIQAYVAKLVQASVSEPPSNNGAKNLRRCFLPCPDAYELALGDVKSAGL